MPLGLAALISFAAHLGNQNVTRKQDLAHPTIRLAEYSRQMHLAGWQVTKRHSDTYTIGSDRLQI